MLCPKNRNARVFNIPLKIQKKHSIVPTDLCFCKKTEKIVGILAINWNFFKR